MVENRRVIVISAINFSEGGPLTILRECLEYASSVLSEKYSIVALVHSLDVCEYPNIQYLEFPRSKKSWLTRLYYEYCHFYFLSKKLKPYLWLSLHDMSANVKADVQAVYCHNPSPFYKLSCADACLDYKFTLFNKLYSCLYGINISNVDYVIVQQDWLRNEFAKRYALENIIVAYPSVSNSLSDVESIPTDTTKFKCVYPAFPRVFKNFEVICQAAHILEERGVSDVEFVLTISGGENAYARKVVSENKSSLVSFVGLLRRDELYKEYYSSDCLIFPSKLETWGLPLTEYKSFNRPILVADCPYAKETVGEYPRVKYFDPSNAEELAECILALKEDRLEFNRDNVSTPNQPFSTSWAGLFKLLLRDF